jgi:RNA polymerase sigma-70 factor (ECF subfamily)
MSIAMNDAGTLRHHVALAAQSQEPDAALVDAARKNDAEAFSKLVTRYGPRIFQLAWRITRNREDAEEVSQDSFTRAFLHMDTFRGDSRFSTWLSRIAINQSLMKLRTHRRSELHFDRLDSAEDMPSCAEIADCSPTPEQRYSQEELLHILASAMDELPLADREVLHLREVEERSTEEAAAILGLSNSALKSRVRRGRQKLHHALKRHFAGKGLARISGRNLVEGEGCDCMGADRGTGDSLFFVHR